MVYYLNKFIDGLKIVSSNGDGYSLNLRWATAYPTVVSNKIYYNIYMSHTDYLPSAIAPIFPENFFLHTPTYASLNGQTGVDILDLIPGQMYHFGVRAAEYDPTTVNPVTILQPATFGNLYTYPESLLAADISATDTIIPLISTEFFPPDGGTVRIGGELILYDSVDASTNSLIVPGGTNGGAVLVKQDDGYYYLSGPNNVGAGILNSLTLVDGHDRTETWTIRCVERLYNSLNQPILGTARFSAIGTVSGGHPGGQEYVWVSDGVIVSNGILSFSITETSQFSVGDYFTVQVLNLLGDESGRGYNNTIANAHDVDGYDGYHYYNPYVIVWPITDEDQNTRVYECWNRFDVDHIPFTMTDGYRQKTVDILTTDLSVSDADNVGFPSYDFAGYHRTDPVMLLSGACVGSYIGGYQFCADGYSGVGMQLRGLNIQDMNNQRQEVLLSTTGESCVFVERQWTGITCSCMLPYNEYPEARCKYCFAPGTLIRTEDGFRPIETIQVGDRVLSSDGSYQRVSKTFENHFDGHLKKITTSTSTNPILTTPDHPFRVLRGDHKPTTRSCGPKCNGFIEQTGDLVGINNQNPDVRLTENGRWQARCTRNYKREVLGTFDTKEQALSAIESFRSKPLKKGHVLEWDDAENIRENDWLVFKYNKQIIDIDRIEIPQEFRKNTKLGSQRNGSNEFVVDEEFLWVIGLYLAEGCSGTREIMFALHREEIEYQNRVAALFTRYGYNCRVKNTADNGAVIHVYGTSLANWFPTLCGSLCYNKKIPEIFMNLPKNKSQALVKGIFDGDGSKRPGEPDITQTSEILALQLAELLEKFGKKPLIRQQISNMLTPKGNKRRVAYNVNWEPDDARNVNRKGRWAIADEVLTKVKKIEETPYVGSVFNLEVEGDNTYVVQNILVHNCFGTGFVVGWQPYYNPRRSDGRIMVRFDPTVDDLIEQDAGLESTMNPTCWTLTVPSLKDRDFLVRFDIGGNEEFRYEILNVTRNKLMFGMEGMQKFALQRIRKTDPIYQVPLFRDTSVFPTSITTGIGSAPGAFAPHTHTIQVSNTITSVSQINQITGITLGHSHVIRAGKVLSGEMGHDHQIILPDPSIYPTNFFVAPE